MIPASESLDRCDAPASPSTAVRPERRSHRSELSGLGMTTVFGGSSDTGTIDGPPQLDRLRRRLLHHLRLRAPGASGLAYPFDPRHFAQDVPGARHRPLLVADLRLLEGRAADHRRQRRHLGARRHHPLLQAALPRPEPRRSSGLTRKAAGHSLVLTVACRLVPKHRAIFVPITHKTQPIGWVPIIAAQDAIAHSCNSTLSLICQVPARSAYNPASRSNPYN